MRNATRGNLQPDAKNKESHNAVDDHLVMRADIANEPVGVEIEQENEQTYTDDGDKQRGHIYNVYSHVLIGALRA